MANVDLSTIQVFDQDGRFVDQVGGDGDGPGEFRRIMELRVLQDGRVAVFDGGAARLTYLSPDLVPLSTHALPVLPSPHGAAPAGGGAWVLTGLIPDPSLMGSAAVLVDSAGTLLHHFWPDLPDGEDPELRGLPVRMIAYHPDHGVVAMQQHIYRFEMWTREGDWLGTLDPQVDWFHWPPDWADADRREVRGTDVGGRAPVDGVAGIQFDHDGRLWILSQVTPDDWQAGLDENGRVVDPARWTDFMVQIYDLDSGTEVCSVRLVDDYYFGGFAGPGLLKTYEEDRIGRPTIEIHRISLER